MKQIDLSKQKQKHPSGTRTGWRLWCMMLLAVLIGTASSFGQDITWQTLSGDDLYRNGLDEGKKLSFYFQAEKTEGTANIQITLPKGVKVTATTPVVAAGTGNDYTFGTATAAPSGDKTIVTIPITGGIISSKVGAGTLDIMANGDATVGTVAITAKVVASGVTDAGTSANVKVNNPQLNVSYIAPASTSDFVNGAEHIVTLTSTGGKTKSVTIDLTVDDTFTLDESSFTFEGGSAGTIAKDGKKYTVTLTDKEFGTTGKVLKFKSVHPGIGGNRVIKYEIKTDCNVKTTGNLNFLVTVADAGPAAMEVESIEYVESDKTTLCYTTGKYPKMDGSLVYIKATYKNTGSGAAAYFQARNTGYPGVWYHKKGETAYYRIDGGTFKEVDADKAVYTTAWKIVEAPLPADISKWFRNLTVDIYDIIPSGKEIEVYFPAYFGDIFESGGENDKVNIIASSRDYHLGARADAIAVKNKKGEVGAAGGILVDYKHSPRFYEKAQSLTFTDEAPSVPGQEVKKEITMNIGSGFLGTTSEYGTNLEINLPAWLTIEDVKISQPQYGSTTTAFSITKVGTNGTLTTYKITSSNSSNGFAKLALTCTFQVNKSPAPGTNKEDIIKYSLKQILTQGGSEDASTETGRMIQPVYYQRTFSGVKLESFKLERDASSQGYAPVYNADDTKMKESGIADGTNPPDQDKIDHTIYMDEDEGAFVWKLKLLETAGSGKAIFLPLETSDFGLSVTKDGLEFKALTVSINNGAETSTGIEYKKTDHLKGYVQYTLAENLTANTELLIRLPFTVKGYKNASRPVSTQALLGNVVTGPAGATGSCVEALSIGTYSLESVMDALAGPLTFATETSEVEEVAGIYTFWSNYLTAPHFPYEVRQLAYLSKLRLKIPKGYTLQVLRLSQPGRFTSSTDYQDLLTGVTVDKDSDPDYDYYTTKVADLFGPGKTWEYPDEKWEHRLNYKLKASTRVKGSSKMYFDVEYSNPSGQVVYKPDTEFSIAKNLAYKGSTISVESLSPLQPANKNETVMSVNFANGSSTQINGNWLMVEGNFSGLTAEVGGSPATVTGNKFVNVASLIAGQGSKVITLKFKFEGAAGEAIKLTSLSGWTNSSYTPSGTPSDNNMGGSCSVIINPLSNKLEASLKVDEVMFKEFETYKLTATLSSASSAGAISNPTMTITPPAGQEVKSAVVKYNGVTYNLTAAQFNTAFPQNSGKFIFDVRKMTGDTNITFPGYSSNPDPKETTATLEITYEPKTGTPTDGTMCFTGKADATGLNEGAISTDVESQKMFPRLDLANTVTVTLTSTGKAFSAITKDQTLTVKVEVNKLTTSFDATDYLELDIPKYLTVGAPTVDKGTTGIVGTPDDSGTSRLVKLTLPVGELTAVGKVVTYTIPVTYNGTGAEQALPKKQLVAKHMTKTALFGNNQIVAASTSSLYALFVKTNAVSIFADQTPGETLTIESTGVTGKFDGGAAASSKVVTAAHSTQNDIAAAAGFTAKETVEVIYDTQSYGMVDLPYTVYPSLVYTLSSNTFTDCGTVTVPYSTLVTAKTATNTTVKFYSDAACTSEITEASKAYTNSTTVYAFASNQGNPDVSTAKAITITVNNNLGVTVTPATTSITAGGSFTLTANVTGTAPAGAKYEWYKDGGASPVSTTAVATYTKTGATASDAGSYHVVITNSDGTTSGLCGNTSTAVTVTVVGAPADVALAAGVTSPKEYCGTVTAGDFLWDMIDHTNTTVTYYYNTDGGATYTSQVSAGNKVQLAAGTYYVKANNGAGTLSTNATALQVVVNTSVSADLAFNGETVTTKTVVVGSSVTFTATGAPAGKHYRLYKGSSALGTSQTSGTFTISSVATTDAGSYTVKIVNADATETGFCGTQQSAALTLNVTVNPANVTLGTTAKTLKDCTMPLTVSPDIHITVNNTTDFTTEEFYWNTSNSTSGAKKVGANQTVSLAAGSHTIFVWAKNSANNFSTTPAQLALTISKYADMVAPTAVAASAAIVEVASGTTGTVTISVPAVTGEPAASGYTYALYDNNVLVGTSGDGRVSANSVTKAGDTHSFTVTYDVPTTASKIHKYTVKVSGMCNTVTSNEVTVTVYPKAEIALNATSVDYCEDNTAGLADIGLYSYIQSSSNLLTYEYKLGTGNWTTLTSSTVVANSNTPDTYTYTLRAKNSNNAYSTATPTVTVNVDKKTAVTGVTGYEVTEGEPIVVTVTAVGEPTLTYAWQKWDGITWQPLGLSGTTETLSASANLNENGDRYRVIVTGGGNAAGCNTATSDFTLKVKPRQNPPLGNNKVTWTVIGYGNVTVTADGYAISNGSHVNDGANLVITATTWKSNVLESITINGSNYRGPQVSYIAANRSNVNIIVTFSGSDPNPDPDSNATIEDGSRIWSEGGYAYIYSETATRARIVTFNGRLVTDQKLSAGENRIQLPDGYYIVTLSDGTTAKIAVRNF